MSGKRSRDKGLNFERAIAKKFREVGFPLAERQLEFQINQAQGIDLKNTGKFHIK